MLAYHATGCESGVLQSTHPHEGSEHSVGWHCMSYGSWTTCALLNVQLKYILPVV